MTDAELAAVVAARLATVLGFPPAAPPERVTQATAAAVILVRNFLYDDTPISDPPTPDPLLPSGEDMLAGLVALGTRLYYDPVSPGGVVGGDAYTGAAIPEDLLAHVRHYFVRYKIGFGIA